MRNPIGYLRSWRPPENKMRKFRKPRFAVDAVIINDSGKKVLLIRRGHEPHKGMWALPGGLFDRNETTEEAVVREAKEETNIDVEVRGLIGVYSGPGRDPRGPNVAVAYLCKKLKGRAKGGDDAAEAKWFNRIKRSELAFDHAQILEDGLRLYSTLEG